ncbi:MAG: radical SAM protein [Bacilli bacterium]|nr:radical SAM protein [Bacilli bacterium]
MDIKIVEERLNEIYKLIKLSLFKEASEKIDIVIEDNNINNEQIKKIINNLLDILFKFNEDRKHKEAIDTVKVISKFKDYIKDKKIENIILNELELAEGKIFLHSKPRSLQVVLTTMCNLDCIMCGLPQAHYVMPDSIKKTIIDYMPYLESVIWQGGEPLLYKGFKDLFYSASKHNVEQTVTTNGLLIDNDILDVIERTQGTIHLDISIDAVDKITYAKIRRKGDFNILLEKIDLINKKMLKKSNQNFMLGMQPVIMKSNYKQLDQMIDFAIEKGFSKILFQRLYPSYLAVNEGLNTDENNLVVEKIKEYKEKLERQQKLINIDSNLEYIKDNLNESFVCNKNAEDNCNNINIEQNNNLFCLAPWKRMFIGREKIVMPVCHCDVDGIKVDNIDDIWNGKGMIDFRKHMLEGTIPNQCNTFCKTSGDCFERIRRTGKC